MKNSNNSQREGCPFWLANYTLCKNAPGRTILLGDKRAVVCRLLMLYAKEFQTYMRIRLVRLVDATRENEKHMSRKRLHLSQVLNTFSVTH